MEGMQEIKQAIERLSPMERRSLEKWIRADADFENDVAEPAFAYADPSERRSISVEEYLQLEEVSTVKHEYVAGALFAMSGASKRHNVISLNVAAALLAHLGAGPCRAYVCDVKVHLTADRDDIFYYPDVMVACDPQDLESHLVRDPKLIVEVLSPSTEAIDRREKALNYRRIPSLEEYVLIGQRRREVTFFRRGDDWCARVLPSSEKIAEFHSVALALPLDRIYDGVP